MSNSNGRIYIDTTTDPDTGISIADLQQVFRIGSGDLGYIISRAGATGAINAWSIHKPIRSAKLGVLTLAERQEKDFGLDIPICTHPNGLDDFILAYPSGYSYLTPRGKDSVPANCEWFRILDFDGYNHYANCFVYQEGSTLPNSYVYGQNGGGLNFQIGLNTGASLRADSIGLGSTASPDGLMLDNTPYGELYFGLLFVTGTTTKTYRLVTSGYAINGQYGPYLHINESNNNGLDGLDTTKTYTVYPVLSLLSHTETAVAPAQGDTLVALPMSAFGFTQTSVVQTQNISITSCYANEINGMLQVDFVLKMAGTPTSMTAAYDIYTASSIGDTTGTKINGMSGTVALTTSQTENVQKRKRMTNPSYVRVYAYNQNSQQVFAQRWAVVSDGPTPDPEPPTPVVD